MVPDLQRMKDPKVWVDAGTQIFFSYALCKVQVQILGMIRLKTFALELNIIDISFLALVIIEIFL